MDSKHKWNIADSITSVRIFAAIALAFISLYSPIFIIIYTICGLTDIIDGTLARKLGIASDFGAKLDSVADLMFYTIMMIKIMPVLWARMPSGIWFLLLVVLILRVVSYTYAWTKYHRFAAIHTYLNKLTGALVFLLPYAIWLTTGVPYCWGLCTLALIAVIEELSIHILSKEYTAEIHSILHMKGRR